jgi:hypothetical protein
MLSRSIQYISDLHLDRYPLGKINYFRSRSPNIVICGDVGSPTHPNFNLFFSFVKKEFDNVYFVAGNHEYNMSSCFSKKQYNINKPRMMDILSKHNIKLLDCTSYELSKDVIIAGCTLWSNPSYKRLAMDNISYINHINIHRMEVDWIKKLITSNMKKKIIIATHYVPTPQLIEAKYYDNTMKPCHWFHTDLEYFINRPLIGWFCGHSHSVIEVKINNVICGINAGHEPKLFYY